MRWILTLLVMALPLAAEAQNLQVCVGATGAVMARARCRAGESKLTATGGATRCRKVETQQSTSNGLALATLECGAGEYLFAHGHTNVSSFSVPLGLVGGEQLLFGSGDKPTGVAVTTRSEVEILR